jgi:hypothetical protein
MIPLTYVDCFCSFLYSEILHTARELIKMDSYRGKPAAELLGIEMMTGNKQDISG